MLVPHPYLCIDSSTLFARYYCYQQLNSLNLNIIHISLPACALSSRMDCQTCRGPVRSVAEKQLTNYLFIILWRNYRNFCFVELEIKAWIMYLDDRNIEFKNLYNVSGPVIFNAIKSRKICKEGFRICKSYTHYLLLTLFPSEVCLFFVEVCVLVRQYDSVCE